MNRLQTSKLAIALIALLAHSPAAFASKLAWHLPNTFSYNFTPPPQNASSRISIKAPVEVKVSVRRTEGSGHPQYNQQLTGGIQKVEAVVGDKSYEAPIACLQNLRWPIQSIAIQQDESFTVVLARTHSITEPTQTFFLRIAINYSDTALQAQKAVTCERKKL
ncbi:MAG: hypothetical protein ACPGJW_10690 [Paracoccaceae bacterium]